MIVDLSGEQPNPPPPTMRKGRDGKPIAAGKARIIGGKAATRTPTGVTIHQTDCYFGAKDDAARHRRALGVHAHWTCFRDGVAVLAYPLDWHVYHGHGFNSSDVGIEIEGRYRGADGAIFEPPAGFDVGKVIQAAREAVQATVQRHPTVRLVHAHRQSSRSRANDPGRLLWHEVGLWAVRELGLVAEPDRALGDGQPLPGDWRA